MILFGYTGERGAGRQGRCDRVPYRQIAEFEFEDHLGTRYAAVSVDGAANFS